MRDILDPGRTGTSMTTTDTVSVAGSGLVFDNTFESSVGSAFENGIITAEQTLAGRWTNAVTLKIDFSVANYGNSGFLASNGWPSFVSVSYTALKNALALHAFSSFAQQAVATLPANNPIPGSNNNTVDWSLPEAYARMLGLSVITPTFDDTVTVNSYYLPTADQAFVNAITHEISEGAMGRVGGDGDQNGAYSVMDLFRYTASGQLDLTDGRDGQATYFSYNGGSTTSQSAVLRFNNEYSGATQVNGGDPADFTGLDVFGVGQDGETFGLSQTDIEVMDVLGWNPASVTASPIVAPSAFGSTAATYDQSWQITGIGSLNNDGHSSLVWQNQSSGLVELQLLEGTRGTGGTIANNPFNSALWQVVGVGDFNGDGLSDLVYRRSSDGVVEVELLSGTSAMGGGIIANTAFDTTWSIVGVGDVTGNGGSDLVWQQPSSGLVAIQLLNGITPVGGGVIANSPFAAGWSVVATGDFNGDGKRDLVLQRTADGLVEMQFLNGTTAIGGGAIANSPFGPEWSVVGAGDILGNGKTDLVYQRPSDGLVEIQYLNGTTAGGGGAIANSPFGPGWQVVGVGDFNGDGKADLVYRNTASGTTEVQFLNGTTAIGGGVVAFGSQLANSAAQLVQAMAGFGAGGALDHGPVGQAALDATNELSLAAAVQHR
jgi:hypothetical protein